MADDTKQEIKEIWDEGLADEEIYHIGKIVAHWGAIEHEVFFQTLQTFENPPVDYNEIPKAMNNMRFDAVLELWNERVVASTKEPKKSVLAKQYKKIKAYQDYRNALVHGMWDWDREKPEIVITTRIKKKQIIKTVFDQVRLHDFYIELAQINLLIRYPGGMQEAFEERASKGFYINEAAFRRMALEKKKQ